MTHLTRRAVLGGLAAGALAALQASERQAWGDVVCATGAYVG